MRKSPQEKKALSYAKDRRNAYGESDKASRRAIPRHKANVNRANRRAASTLLVGAVGSVDVERADTVATVLAGRRPKRWRKWPDRRLDEHVAHVQKRRATFQRMHGRLVQQSAERLARAGELAEDEHVLAAAYSSAAGCRSCSVVLTDQALLLWDSEYRRIRVRLVDVADWQVNGPTLCLTTRSGERHTAPVEENHGLLHELPAALSSLTSRP